MQNLYIDLTLLSNILLWLHESRFHHYNVREYSVMLKIRTKTNPSSNKDETQIKRLTPVEEENRPRYHERRPATTNK